MEAAGEKIPKAAQLGGHKKKRSGFLGLFKRKKKMQAEGLSRWGTGAFWAPLYGAPLNQGGLRGLAKGEVITSNFNKHKKKMNRYPDHGSTYKGEILMSMHVDFNENGDHSGVVHKAEADVLPETLVHSKTKKCVPQWHSIAGRWSIQRSPVLLWCVVLVGVLWFGAAGMCWQPWWSRDQTYPSSTPLHTSASCVSWPCRCRSAVTPSRPSAPTTWMACARGTTSCWTKRCCLVIFLRRFRTCSCTWCSARSVVAVR